MTTEVLMKKAFILSVATMCVSAALASCTTTGADGLSRHQKNITVASGERTKLGAAFSLNPDCTAKAVPEVRIREAPKHGKVESLRELAFPNSKGEYKKCASTKVIATVGYYTPDKGFVGKDRVVVRTSYKNGVVDEGVINITVVE
ncbi:hypothetical protein [Rhizobium leguminosarum]|uniref:hypothetical protein n=1 Tax=Rhizobium leguminosarum TaxID=384 RepID=UPI001FF03C68|nr:hypothetical protein [Rhizobium leguminosarum]